MHRGTACATEAGDRPEIVTGRPRGLISRSFAGSEASNCVFRPHLGTRILRLELKTFWPLPRPGLRSSLLRPEGNSQL
jgi:hypothetical protein